jgi:hypothetical protein
MQVEPTRTPLNPRLRYSALVPLIIVGALPVLARLPLTDRVIYPLLALFRLPANLTAWVVWVGVLAVLLPLALYANRPAMRRVAALQMAGILLVLTAGCGVVAYFVGSTLGEWDRIDSLDANGHRYLLDAYESGSDGFTYDAFICDGSGILCRRLEPDLPAFPSGALSLRADGSQVVVVDETDTVLTVIDGD